MEQSRMAIVLFLLLVRGALGEAQQSCGRFPSTEQFTVSESDIWTGDVTYIAPNTTAIVGYVVVVPEMEFTCHGYITGWSAVTQLNSNFAAIDNLNHDITFQLWRPNPRGSGLYTFVGSHTLAFVGLELRSGLTVINGTQIFRFGPKLNGEKERLYFQPGDVVGWYIHTLIQSTERPLNIVYRDVTNTTEPNLRPVDMYTTVIPDTSKAATPPPCELSLCGGQLSHISSVIPYVTVHYVSENRTAPTQGAKMCVNNSDLLTSCDPPNTQSSSSTPVTSSATPTTRQTSSPFTLPVIVGAVTSVLLIVATVTFIVIVCMCARGRACIFTPIKRRTSFHDNPTYTSPDHYINAESPSTPCSAMFSPAPVQHYPAEDGALYAVPDTNASSLANSRTQLDPQHLFDGECYATTYQTNGQCHVYQELTEMQPEKRGSIFSRSSLHITKQELPELPTPHKSIHSSSTLKLTHSVPRFSISTGTLPAHFPYTLPNTPAPSHPYLEAVDSRPLQLPPTPDDTPPHSAGAIPLVNGAPVRRLFHSIDDEGYHVPTQEERMQFLGYGSTEELYSRLNRPHAKTRDSRELNFFEQAETYWEPPSSTAELYNQLARKKYREIRRDQIHVIAALGSGQFGAVSHGYWEVPGGKIDIAIKFLQPGSSEEDKAQFLQEAAIMGQFLHPNIVKLHGVVTLGEPMMIVLELMPKGDLKQYLKELHARAPNLPFDLPELFLNFCRQIGYGMNYLSNKAFIHRDLAARNILLTEDLTCKIGDFGMTRALSDNETYESHGGKIPLKWTAPEALRYRRFTTASDVWSYGIVLFEIWSLGQQPFRRISDANKLMSLVNSGHCQAPPPGCPRAVYQLMVNCWHPNPDTRPRFSEICDYLKVDNETLLHWSSSDRILSPSVTHLGAPLDEARNLYPDLQYAYDNDTAV